MTMQQINDRLKQLKDRKSRVVGRETEVYARIVGYYRSVRNWNKGKKEEYGMRANYAATPTPKAPMNPTVLSDESREKQVDLNSLTALSTPVAGYLYFFRKTCPNCPPVANWLRHSGLEGRSIDVDRESGLHEAQRFNITAAPTVVLLDEAGNETGRASSVSALESQVSLAVAAGA